MAEAFAARLLRWYDLHGRKDLPWQKPRSPYRVWLSEVMLQQTQVATVVPYFLRFVEKFASLRGLAAAKLDDVLALWSGLGYYSRARNLHRTAQICVERHRGSLPRDFDALTALPGIGRSTAGAILAQAHGLRFAILDGNVKRVLARYYAVDGPPDDSTTLERLWQLAEVNTPQADVAVYTQAVMDLGATLCARKPRCADCPIAADCRARLEGREAELPAAKRRRAPRRLRRAVMLVARHASAVLLVQRPASGIWGGLWCLPEFDDRDAAEQFANRQLSSARLARAALPEIEHSFTHFDLVITPIEARCRGTQRVNEAGELWYDLAQPARVGLPAPIKSLLGRLSER